LRKRGWSRTDLGIGYHLHREYIKPDLGTSSPISPSSVMVFGMHANTDAIFTPHSPDEVAILSIRTPVLI
jgi:hypothetical protein